MSNIISNSTLNGILSYVEILNDVNVDFIKIISLDCIDNMNLLKKLYLDVSSKISMLIQTLIPRDSKDYKDLKLIMLKQGINKYFPDFSYLQQDIELTFEKNKELLYSLKKVRNKIEHDLDIIITSEMHSGSGICGVIFKIKDSEVSIQSIDLKKLIIDINILFSKMLDDIDKYVINYDKDNYNHKYYTNLRKYDFKAYNKIIKSNLLYDVSLLLNNKNV